ncbi:MAG: hypothetical protein N3D11_15490, partial [Candidatus Sumerlaeia bacterium]|nr:hypothetical protein [Candidatus Sumerlaeia bacterium]
ESKHGMYFARPLECGSHAAALLYGELKPAKRGPLRENEPFFSHRAIIKSGSMAAALQSHRGLWPRQKMSEGKGWKSEKIFATSLHLLTKESNV